MSALHPGGMKEVHDGLSFATKYRKVRSACLFLRHFLTVAEPMCWSAHLQDGVVEWERGNAEDALKASSFQVAKHLVNS